MAEEIGKEAIEKQMEVMEEHQQKAQEFIDEKVCLDFVRGPLFYESNQSMSQGYFLTK